MREKRRVSTDANFDFFFETSNGRLTLEDGSDRRETWPKRVSDDSQRFIFRHRKKVLDDSFFQTSLVLDFFSRNWRLDEPGNFERHWQIRRQKLLPEVGLFLGRLPWRRGKRLNLCRKSGPGTKNDFNHLVLGWKIFDTV